MAAAGGGPRFSAPPLTRLLLPRRHPGSRRELSRGLRPCREAPRFPPPPRSVPDLHRPCCPRPRSVWPRCRPHYLSRRPGPTVRDPWARAGQPSSRLARPGERSAASSRAGFRGHRRAPSRPALGPRPGRRRRRSRGRRGNGAAAAAAAATEPGRGEGGISPQAGSAPPASPPPPATSTPSLAPSMAPRALPLNGIESARGKTGEEKKKKIPPPVPGAAAAAGAVRSGARSRCRHRARSPARPHGGGADAAGARSKGGICARRSPGSPRPGSPPSGRARPESWRTFGSNWERHKSLTPLRVVGHPLSPALRGRRLRFGATAPLPELEGL